jgi:hypothetical protein
VVCSTLIPPAARVPVCGELVLFSAVMQLTHVLAVSMAITADLHASPEVPTIAATPQMRRHMKPARPSIDSPIGADLEPAMP